MARVCVCSEFFEITDTGELCFKRESVGLQQTLVFSTPGTTAFNKASFPGLTRVRVRVIGGGGGGPGADANTGETIARNAGSGGAYSESVLSASALGATENIVVGQGGAGGVGNNDGDDGTPSSFAGVTAPGGLGGTAQQASGTDLDAVTGRSGPSAGTGQIAIGGGAGGGGGRFDAQDGYSGEGGHTPLGFGGAVRASEGNGNAGRGFGAGGAGALSFGASVNGAAGRDGVVILELFF